jgi:mRNA-degrading endonuclease toxin of MazEF toxin-antitoxin module
LDWENDGEGVRPGRKTDLLLGAHPHAGHRAAITMPRLVLQRQVVNADTFAIVILKILNQVICIRDKGFVIVTEPAIT